MIRILSLNVEKNRPNHAIFSNYFAILKCIRLSTLIGKAWKFTRFIQGCS